MGANYERGLFKQLQDVMAAFEKLSLEFEQFKVGHKREIAALKETHRQESAQQKAAYQREVATLKARVESLEAENALLKVQLGKDSGNSGKPPSADGFKKLENSREKSARPSGGQKGHKGHIPILCESPDEVIHLTREACDCGGKIEYAKGNQRRQHINLRVVAHVREYVSAEGKCSCCGKHYPKQFPEGLPGIINIGHDAKAVVALLLNEGAVSVTRTQQILRELTEGRMNLSEASILQYQQELSEKIQPEIDKIRQDLSFANVLHKDESGVRINGKLHWLHVLCTPETTYYAVHPKRGSDADRAMDIVSAWNGVLVHDHLRSLYDFPCAHAECNAHVLRYLKGVCAHDETFAPFAQSLRELLREMNNRRKELIEKGQLSFPVEEVHMLQQRYDSILVAWNALTQSKEIQRKMKGHKYKSDAEPLGKRLSKYKQQHLLFLEDFHVPFENNQAERDIRPVKTKLKVSGGFRSQQGAHAYARIRSFISTLRKRKQNIFLGLRSAFSGLPSLG